MSVPHPIPYQGSKRGLAPLIIRYFPTKVRLIEPFAGSAAVSLAAAYYGKTEHIVLNDVNKPLMELWRMIINEPEEIVAKYRRLWESQRGRERQYYDLVRTKFNKTHHPEHLLYLLARCVKSAVRYNVYGDFNQSPDNRRKGMNPRTLLRHVIGASRLLEGKTRISAVDFQEVLSSVRRDELVYMDPPYQGVCENGDPRYVMGVDSNRFIKSLLSLNDRGISYIVSYDGRTGSKQHGKPLPAHLDLTHIEVDAGRSTQETLLGRKTTTFESVYLSPALVQRIGNPQKAKQVAISLGFCSDSTEVAERIP